MTQVSQFQELLSESLTDKGMNVSRWRGGTRVSNHLLSVSTAPQPTVLYVKESNSALGFWGLTRNQVDCLEKTSIRWFVVLLHRAPDAGYVLEGSVIRDLVNRGDVTLSGDGDYKLHESDLGTMCCFRGIKDLLNHLM